MAGFRVARGLALLVVCTLTRAGRRVNIRPAYISVGGQPCRPVPHPRWTVLHIPKCGSVVEELGFDYAMVMHGLERHRPLLGARAAWAKTMTLLRQPEERVVSMYMYFLRHPPPSNYNFHNGFGFVSREQMRKVYADVRALRPVAEVFAPFRGCQTNMINHQYCMHRTGYHDAARTSPAARERWVREAVGKLAQLGFVGILEELRLSVCLLNALLTGEPFYMHRQLRTANPTMPDESSALFEASTSQAAAARARVNTTLERDEVDGALYDAARALLRRRLDAANVTQETCRSRPDDYVKPCACSVAATPRAPAPARASAASASESAYHGSAAEFAPPCSEEQAAAAASARDAAAAAQAIAGAGCCAVLPASMRPRALAA